MCAVFDSVILNRMVSPSKKGTGMVEPENMITLKFVQDALTNKDGRLQCIQTRTVLWLFRNYSLFFDFGDL